MKSIRKNLILYLIFIIMVIVFSFLLKRDYQSILDKQHSQLENEYAIVTNQFISNIDNTFSFIYSLRGFVYSNTDHEITSDKFNIFATETQSHSYYVKNFSIAPDNIQKHVYPIKGNELTIGHNLATDSRENVRNDIKKAMTSADIILSGPYELRQGGLGLVVRNPIYADSKYWGLVNVVIDLEGIIYKSDISKSSHIQYEMINDNGVFWGSIDRDGINFETIMPLANDRWIIRGNIYEHLTIENLSVFIRNSTITFLFLAMIFYYILKSITQNFLLSTKIQRLIYTDNLTGLPNRRALEMKLDAFIHEKRYFGLAFIDLDNFKDINDSLGHSYGDELLIEMADRISSSDDYHTYRWGGDEFIIVSDNETVDFIDILDQIQNRITKSVILNKDSYYMTSSIGVCYYPNDGLTKDEIIRLADASMYHVKKSGKNNLQIYNESFGKNIKEEFEIERKLENALMNNELELYYQPKYNLKNQSIDGVEALLRWQLEDGSFIPPSTFIKVAERSSLIFLIDEYVLDNVLKQIRAWSLEDFRPVVSINVSANHFSKKFSNLIKEKIQEYQIDGHQLEIEMTETAAIENYEITKTFLKEMLDIDVKTVLDDFGTGYSSLSYLTKLGFNSIKIDRSFIMSMEESKHNLVIVKSIVEIAKLLDFDIVAEGVETLKQLEIIRDIGCNHFQGYYLSKALPANDIINFIDEYTKNPYF